MDISVFAQLRKHDKACSMDETAYRQSRLCRLLGNPVAFAIVRALAENDEMSPGSVANAVGRSVSRVSHILAALRLAEVVRYETDGRREAQTPARSSGDPQGLIGIRRFRLTFPVIFADLRN